ncbi:MAG: glycosyltransferase [Candidatus Ancillula sp.]|jgi:glycosyltransferase involved in cell wall biosynthesis|nr:glycosyltransferase [Candidatus Ancillula sp.]
MNIRPLISIVVPVYNTEMYIAECLDSIIAQTYQNWECIIVNDGSTDGSQSVIDRYCGEDKRFSCIKKGNSGVNYARRDGFLASSGEYVQFLDSDDWLDPRWLELLLGFAIDENLDSSDGQRVRISPELRVVRDVDNSHRKLVCTDPEAIISANAGCNVKNGVAVGVVSSLLKRHLVDGHDWDWNDRSLQEDAMMAMAMALKAKRTGYLTDAIQYYRIRKGSATKTLDYSEVRFTDIPEKVIALYQEHGVLYPGLEDAIYMRQFGLAFSELMSYIDDGASLAYLSMRRKITLEPIRTIQNWKHYLSGRQKVLVPLTLKCLPLVVLVRKVACMLGKTV